MVHIGEQLHGLNLQHNLVSNDEVESILAEVFSTIRHERELFALEREAALAKFDA